MNAAQNGYPISEGERFVLCVDDDADFLKSLEGFLPDRINQNRGQDLWYRFLFHTDPLRALSELDDLLSSHETVAMFITDQQMPTMRGLDFLARARRASERSIRVLLTGHAGMESAIRAINDRLLDKYLTKPIYNEEEFALAIEHLLRHFEMQRTIEAQDEMIHGLYGFATGLHGCESMEGTLRRIADFVSESLGCATTCVVLLDQGRIAGSAVHGMASLPVGTPTTPSLVEIVPGLHPIVHGAEEIPWIGGLLAPRCGEAAAGAWVVVPLIAEGRVLGLVCAAEHGRSRPLGLADCDAMLYVGNTASMAIHNQTSRAALQRAYVTEREHGEALLEANHRLEVLDRLKSDFLSFISHELRTPLNIMAALSLVDDAMDPEERTRMMEIARKGYDRLERFVAKGLEYFGWVGTTPPPTDETCDLSAVARTAAEAFGGDEAERGMIELEIAEGPLAVALPAVHAFEVLKTLIENAFKFSGSSPWARLTLACEGDSIVGCVRDRGRGFAPELAAEILQPFTIAHVSEHRHGSGLSLATVSAILGAYGGSITAHSDGPGKGAAFTFRLPIAGASGRSASATPTDGQDPEAPRLAA